MINRSQGRTPTATIEGCGVGKRDRPPLGRSLTTLIGVVALSALVVGCGADRPDAVAGIAWNPDSTNAVNGYELESTIISDHTSINAGRVNFTFANHGTETHEVVLIRTDDAPGSIPIGANGRLNEDDPQTLNVGETEEMEPGKVVTFSETLPPGHYQLVCNLANHYTAGMYAEFTVR